MSISCLRRCTKGVHQGSPSIPGHGSHVTHQQNLSAGFDDIAAGGLSSTATGHRGTCPKSW